MRYIKKIILENFQSHKYSIIELNEELNVIVGPSDTGKSAIIRGLKWALYNEPSGDYFIREGEREASVTIEFSDNTIIKRYRSKSKNIYYLYKINGEELVFEGFGTNVPQEIIDEIGIEKIHLDSEESVSINLGEQLEGAFLLSEKSAIRASAIGRLVGVNVIDDALRESLKDNRNISTIRKTLDDSVLTLEEELKQYDYLSEINNKLNKIDAIKGNIIEKTEKYNTLIRLNDNLNKSNLSLTESIIYLNKLKEIKNIDLKVSKIEDLYIKHKYFINKKNNYLKIVNGIKEDDYIINKLKNLNLTQNIFELLSNSLIKLNKLQNVQYKKIKYESEITKCNNIIDKLKYVSVIENSSVIMQNRLTLLKSFININENMNINMRNILIGQKYISKFNNLNIVDINLSKLEILERKLTNLQHTNDKIKKINLEKTKIVNNVIQNKKDINDFLIDYEELLSKQEICPFCLSSIDDGKIKHIMAHYK